MTTASGLVQHNLAAALERALREHGGSGDANQETAAMRGVIDFLKKYMKNGGKTRAAAKGGGAKMRGEAAALALQAIEFANKCGGLSITFHSDGQDVSQEEDEGNSRNLLIKRLRGVVLSLRRSMGLPPRVPSALMRLSKQNGHWRRYFGSDQETGLYPSKTGVGWTTILVPRSREG